MTEQSKLLQQVEEIRRRAEAATKGPWNDWDFDGSESEYERVTGLWITVGTFPGEVICNFGVNPSQQDYANAKFAAAARTDVPALCSALVTLAQAVEAREVLIHHFDDAVCPMCEAGEKCTAVPALADDCDEKHAAAVALLRDGMARKSPPDATGAPTAND